MLPRFAQEHTWDRDYAIALDTWHGQNRARATALPLDMRILAAREGNSIAFSSLAQQFYPAALRVARQILLSEDAAADAVQDALVKANHAMSRFQDGNFRSWLLRIVTNTCYDQLRRQKRSKTVSLDERTEETNGELTFHIQPITPVHMADDPAMVAANNETMQNLLMTIDELSALHRTVVLLVDVQGYDYAEAAVLLQVPLGTVKSRLSRGRCALRDRLVAVGLVVPAPQLV